ncbi:MAG: hypothetical protein ACLUTZ_11285 [Oliverpabstia sp.]
MRARPQTTSSESRPVPPVGATTVKRTKTGGTMRDEKENCSADACAAMIMSMMTGWNTARE